MKLETILKTIAETAEHYYKEGMTVEWSKRWDSVYSISALEKFLFDLYMKTKDFDVFLLQSKFADYTFEIINRQK